MKISLEWLGDFITFENNDPQEIARVITAHTAEVDEVEVQGEVLENCCMGKVLKLSQHPDADRLQLCEVLTDKGTQNVVCGGTNLREGMRVAFAHVGATVQSPDGLFTLEKIKIRGEESSGMICAAEELELEDMYPPTEDQGKKPIIDFGDGDEDVGKPLREVLGLNDTVLHIDNHAITHRADLFSHIGFAFECVAMGIAKWKKMPEMNKPTFPTDKMSFAFRVATKDSIHRYLSCVITIDELGETPDFMKRRLAACGIRSITLPVDITNYVMLEVGVPMHSFDLADIKGDITARLAKKDEPMQTLDGQEWKLPEGALIFNDEEGIFDLVGIMGGMRSSTTESTRQIYLHALSLDPVRIRSTVIATGHRTDAATVYEKKVPHVATELGFYRALELFSAHVPGFKITSELEEYGDNGAPKAIKFSVERAQSMLGAEISSNDMKKIFEDLGFTVDELSDGLAVTPPLHRIGDIEGEHDLVEEVGRMYGYDNIENTLPTAAIDPPVRDQRVHKMRDALQDQGYFELLPLSLIGAELLKKCKIDSESCTVIDNAIGKETSLMTPSTLPALLEQAEKNMLQVESVLRTFHVSTVFADGKDSHTELGMLVTAKSTTDLKSDPFLLAKQELEEALVDAGYSISIDICEDIPAYASSGRCASILLNKKEVGTIFEVEQDVRSKFDLPGRAAAVLLNLTTVLEEESKTIVFETLPEYPAIKYDVTIRLTYDRQLDKLKQEIYKCSDLIESVEVVDIYTGYFKRLKFIPAEDLHPGEYNLTLRCVFRAKDRTLEIKDINPIMQKLGKLGVAFAAKTGT